MTYDKRDFESVIETVDIKQEIESRIGALKRVGSNYQGCCPFHSEKSPSFTVSPTKRIWKCFGCGEQGDVISFVAKYDSISQMEAMRKLAKENNITVTTQQTEEGVTNIEEAYNALKIAQISFESALLHNKAVKRYIVDRGINTAALVKEWGIGWADNDYLLEADQDGMKTAGLIRNNKLFFRNRVMFPIMDTTGRVVGFGGRDISGTQKAKYMNTPDTSLYNKSQVLFGLRQALKNIKQYGAVIITEGYFDVILLHQIKGFDIAVAPCGTALTNDHAELLAKYCKIASIMFDGDKAGRMATVKAISSLINAGFKTIEVTILPDAADAADMVLGCNRDRKTFIDNVEQVSGMTFLAQYIEGDDEEKIKAILTILSNCPSPIRRDDYVKELAELTGYSQYTLIEELNILLKRKAWA